MSDLPATLEQLAERLAQLERRVAVLESAGAPAPAPVVLAAQIPDEGLSLAQAGGTFAVLGKAMLGIAGAYVLRAVAESGVLPQLTMAALAIVYALLWLVAAARTRPQAWAASAIYASTSGLILAPMLWELTLSFRVLSPWAAGVILAGYALAACALGWKRNLPAVFWVANVTAAAGSLALLVATRQPEPFV
ncbi:MAG: hypothetical protein WCE75_07240, partial [Terracidiphilus sp.]